MTPLEKMSDEDFERHALAILQRELGLDGLARFLRLDRASTGDYTRDGHGRGKQDRRDHGGGQSSRKSTCTEMTCTPPDPAGAQGGLCVVRLRVPRSGVGAHLAEDAGFLRPGPWSGIAEETPSHVRETQILVVSLPQGTVRA